MKYRDFVKTQVENNTYLGQICDLLTKVKKIITFSHDDPDGVTSAALFKRLTNSLGIENYILFPTKYELSKEEITAAIENFGIPQAIFVLDKGTIEYYNEYSSLVENFVVIDHHPPIGERFDKILVYNPSLKKYTQCSCSLLIHILFNLLSNTNDVDDVLSLIGLKSDWGIDPLNNIIPEFCQPFYDEKIQNYSFLVETREDLAPTIFEISDRSKSCLLNHISQLTFALTGGGFQYFYNDFDDRLKNVNQPELCFSIFVSGFETRQFSTVEEFINRLKEKEYVKLIYNYFLQELKSVEEKFDKDTIFVKEKDNIKIYFFFGNRVRLMPMVGSIKLYQFTKGAEGIIFMINVDFDGGVHISFRSNTEKVHLGKIATTVAKQLVSKYGHSDEITGGGHPKAAEVKTRQSGVPYFDVLSEFFAILKDFV